MRVSLFITCLVDQLWPSVGAGAVEVLRRAGCEVVFDERQTCCGQPAFNTGYRAEARRLARRFIEIFEDGGADYLVSPSGSCTAMAHHLHELFADDEPWRRRAERVAARTREFGSFLVGVLGVEDVGASFNGRVTWRDACHGLRDLGVRDEPRRLIRRVRERGVGMVYISHRLEELPAIADRVTVLRDGRTIDTRPMREVSRQQLIQMMVGRELSAVFPKREVALGGVALELRGLGCAESGVRGVNLSVRAGEIVGLAGPVGAGRTELARAVFGLTPADEGQILLRGEPVRIRSPADALRRGIAYLPEDRRRHGVILDMQIGANITLARSAGSRGAARSTWGASAGSRASTRAASASRRRPSTPRPPRSRAGTSRRSRSRAGS